MNNPGEIAKGCAELRRYVEANGFEWCEDESVVFNVTTAIGLMGGTIDALNKKNKELENQVDVLSSVTNSYVPDYYTKREEIIQYLQGRVDKYRRALEVETEVGYKLFCAGRHNEAEEALRFVKQMGEPPCSK